MQLVLAQHLFMWQKIQLRFLVNIGLFTALGTGTGAAIFGLLAVMGLQAILLAVPSAYLILKNFWWSVSIWFGL